MFWKDLEEEKGGEEGCGVGGSGECGVGVVRTYTKMNKTKCSLFEEELRSVVADARRALCGAWGYTLVAGTSDGKVLSWRDGDAAKVFGGSVEGFCEEDEVRSLAWIGEDGVLAVCSGSSVSFVDWKEVEEVGAGEIRGFSEPSQVFRASSTLVVGAESSASTLAGDAAPGIRNVSWTDGIGLVGACEDGRGVVWDVERESVVASLGGHVGVVRRALGVGGEGLVVTGGDDGTVRLFDVRAGKRVHLLHAGFPIRALAADTIRSAVAAGGHGGVVQRFDLRSGALESETKISIPTESKRVAVRSVCFSQSLGLVAGSNKSTLSFIDEIEASASSSSSALSTSSPHHTTSLYARPVPVRQLLDAGERGVAAVVGEGGVQMFPSISTVPDTIYPVQVPLRSISEAEEGGGRGKGGGE